MHIETFADNPRMQTLLRMLRELSLAQTPAEAMSAWAMGYWRLNPIDHMLSVSTRDLTEGQYRVTRNVRVSEAVAAGRSVGEPIRDRHALPVHRGGFLGGMIADGRPKLVSALDVRDDPVLGDAIAGMGSAMIIPLFHEGQPVYWNVSLVRDPQAFTRENLERSIVVANLVGGNNTRLQLVQEVRRLNARLTEQLEDVARVQRSLLPKQIPQIPGLAIATSYLTSDQAGGDYYDFFRLADDQWGILIADVAGHGAAAATIMAMLHGILHAYVSGPEGRGGGTAPDEAMRYANARLVEADIEGSFVTAFFAVYEPPTGRVRYARSGHNPPMLKAGGSGGVRLVEGAGALPLGVLEPYAVHSEELTLAPGDTLVLYTDGITEAFDAGNRMFGVERLEAALTACSGVPDCVVDSVHAALFAHTGTRTRVDDQTLVAIQRVAGPGSR